MCLLMAGKKETIEEECEKVFVCRVRGSVVPVALYHSFFPALTESSCMSFFFLLQFDLIWTTYCFTYSVEEILFVSACCSLREKESRWTFRWRADKQTHLNHRMTLERTAGEGGREMRS